MYVIHCYDPEIIIIHCVINKILAHRMTYIMSQYDNDVLQLLYK